MTHLNVTHVAKLAFSNVEQASRNVRLFVADLIEHITFTLPSFILVAKHDDRSRRMHVKRMCSASALVSTKLVRLQKNLKRNESNECVVRCKFHIEEKFEN
jgi:hypothetical protein